MSYKYTAVIDRDDVHVIGMADRGLITIVIACPHCKRRDFHEIDGLRNWINFHVNCQYCKGHSLLPNYDYGTELKALNPLGWIDQPQSLCPECGRIAPYDNALCEDCFNALGDQRVPDIDDQD